MNTVVNVDSSSMYISDALDVSISIIDQTNIVVTETSVSDIVFTDIGVQGMKGAIGPEGPIGPPLEFNLLTEEQKIELRGDVGNTSTNYTNLFNSVLLS